MDYDIERLYKDLTGMGFKSNAFEPVPLELKEFCGIKLPEDANVSYIPESGEVVVKCGKGYLSVSNLNGGRIGVGIVDVCGSSPAETNGPLTNNVGDAWKECLEAYKSGI